MQSSVSCYGKKQYGNMIMEGPKLMIEISSRFYWDTVYVCMKF